MVGGAESSAAVSMAQPSGPLPCGTGMGHARLRAKGFSHHENPCALRLRSAIFAGQISAEQRPDSVPTFEPWNEQRAAEIIAAHCAGEGPALPILHALQAAFGHIPEDAVRMVAQALNVSRAEMHGVVTFYHDFRRKVPGAHVLKLCQAEACQALGARELARRASATLGVAMGETTPDARVTLEPVYCLGLCATAPSAMLDDRVVGRLDEAKLNVLLTEAQR